MRYGGRGSTLRHYYFFNFFFLYNFIFHVLFTLISILLNTRTNYNYKIYIDNLNLILLLRKSYNLIYLI